MKSNKMLIFSIVLIITGIIGGGLFAIANSLNILAAELSSSMKAPNTVCGLILFVLLALAAIGLVMFVLEVFGNKEEKQNKDNLEK